MIDTPFTFALQTHSWTTHRAKHSAFLKRADKVTITHSKLCLCCFVELYRYNSHTCNRDDY